MPIKLALLSFGLLGIEIEPLPITQAVLPTSQVTLTPLKYPIMYFKHRLSKYHLLDALALGTVNTTLHLSWYFQN